MSAEKCDSSRVVIHYFYFHELNMMRYGWFIQEIHVGLFNYCTSVCFCVSCFSPTHKNFKLFWHLTYILYYSIQQFSDHILMRG